jgi:hypothetical protein
MVCARPMNDRQKDGAENMITLGMLLVTFGGTPTAMLCPPCDVTLDPVIEIGSLDDPVGRSMEGHLARFSDGRFAYAPMLGAPQIAVYTRTGAFQRMFEKKGQGPGELTTFVLRMGVTRADTLVVWSGGRLLRFTPDLVPMHTEQWTSPARSISVLPDGMLVANFSLAAGGSTMLSHVLDGTRVVRSFDPVRPNETPADQTRIFAAGSDGTVWVGRTNQLWFAQYDENGRLLREFRPQVAWFPRWTSRPEGTPFRARPLPYVSGVSELESGRVLALVTVPDSRWQPVREGVATPSSSLDHVYDTILLVLDSRTGEVLATHRSDTQLRFVSGTSDLVHAPVNLPSGDIAIIVWRVRLNTGR